VLAPAVVRSISGVLQSGLERILWAVAAIAFAGFAASLFFPAMRVLARKPTSSVDDVEAGASPPLQ
jgi:hypothetical protein